MRQKKKNSRRLTIAFSLSVGAILLVTVGMLLAVNYIFMYFNIIDVNQENFQAWSYFLIGLTSSVLIGTGLSALVSRIVIRPIDRLIEGMKTLSNGDYSARVDLGNHELAKNLTDSFNKLAKELESNEVLHNDFINNFSHEFKTPIASINGLINLLKKKKLSEEKRKEYLLIIEEEIERLSSMTSNILNLSKIENKGILKDLERYNLSEQIRNCILLCEKKWSRKKITLSLDFDEFYITGNLDLLKQVWLNLIDNAIKFADEKSELKILITQNNDYTSISIDNVGVEIKESDREKIFNKFYQVDSSHTREGNGIGLSIVKSIIDLHKGNISVNCNNGHTIFKIDIPNNL